MGDKDLEKVLDQISSSERKQAVKQAQIDRLRELTEKQKKIIEDLNRIIEDQKQKIDSMFDVPADVEEIKKIVGSQRAEINDKDQKLELSYSRIAELEQELKGTTQTQNIMDKKFEDTFSQIGTIKADLAEKTASINLKETQIQNLNIKVQELEKINEQHRKQVSDLQESLRNKDLQLIEEKNKISAELKTKALAEKDEAFKKVKELEAELLDQDMKNKESLASAKQTDAAYNEMKKKMEDMINKYDVLKNANIDQENKLRDMGNELEILRKFKDDNESVVVIFNKLKILLEKEPMFQIFCIVWDIGAAPVSDLKNAIGVPTVTIQKYVQKYIEAELFQVNEDGKITLIDRPRI